MVRYLKSWIAQLRWQRLEPFRKLAKMLIDHIDGILIAARPSPAGSGRSRERQHRVTASPWPRI